MTINKDEKSKLKIKLESVTEYYSKVLKISMTPSYRGELDDELKKINEEIKQIKDELQKFK